MKIINNVTSVPTIDENNTTNIINPNNINSYNFTEKQQQLITILKSLIPYGYKTYIYHNSERPYRDSAFGYIITPSKNILYIQSEHFGEWSFFFEYKRDRNFGGGCQCLEESVDNVTVDIVRQAEKEGYEFAESLKIHKTTYRGGYITPTFYKNPDEWFDGYWAKRLLVEIV